MKWSQNFARLGKFLSQKREQNTIILMVMNDEYDSQKKNTER